MGAARPHNPAARGELLGATAPWRNRSQTKKNKPTLNTKLRILPKAEILDKGQNPRFVVTNLPAEGLPGEPQERFAARALYEKLYCARGEMENRIKEAQQDLFADRTSTGWMASNQLRLSFSAFAHLMVSVLRAQVLRGTDLARAILGQIRLKLFKIGARIKISGRRIHLELASAYPYQETFRRACANLCAMPAG